MAFTLSKRFIQLALCVLFCGILGACASSQKETNSQAAPPEEDTPPTLRIESSHGVQEIQPTVVAYSKTQGDHQEAQTSSEFSDPLEAINRPVFAFNNVLFRYFLIPVSHGYKAITPELFRTGISNVFANIREPLNAINHLAQAEGRSFGHNLSRFLINSSLGILGLFDPADAWFGIESRVSHIDDTLRTYGVGYGSYLVLPFFGQSDLRNGFSILSESFASPIRYITDNPETLYIQAYQGFHLAVPKLLTYEELHQHKEDPYVFFRNLYMQGILRDQQYPAGRMREQQDSEAKP